MALLIEIAAIILVALLVTFVGGMLELRARNRTHEIPPRRRK